MREIEVKYSKYMRLQLLLEWLLCYDNELYFFLRGDFVREIEKDMEMCLWAAK